MHSRDVSIRSSEGPAFDCYLAVPDSDAPVPAVVLASSIYGVDRDLRAIADEFGSRGFLAAAPDLFWRSVPGPLLRDDPRAAARGQPRLEKIRIGEQDVRDVLEQLREQPLFNGRAAVIGFCYGGPYAILGPKRLGYQAGISCHGSQMLDYLGELEGIDKPLCVMWGDQDRLAPAAVRDAYRAASVRMKEVEVHVFPGVQHGYMMPGHAAAFDQNACDSSMERALALLRSMQEGRRP